MHTTWDLLDLLIQEICSLFTGAACLAQKYSLHYCIIGMLNICLTAALLGRNRTRMYRLANTANRDPDVYIYTEIDVVILIVDSWLVG